LTDLREIISVTQVREQRSFQDILFTYCSSLDESLTRADFQVEYEVPEGLELVLLADLSKQVMRIVEESVANTIKYARASRLSIRMAVTEAESLEVVIEDNGQSVERTGEAVEATGRRASALHGGTGLAGLRRRARRIGATFDFERAPHGARTLLRLPLLARADARPGNESVRHSSQSGRAALPLG